MTLSLILITYVVLAGTLGAAVLGSAQWTQRAPRIGIVAWQALTTSILVGGLLTGLNMAVPHRGASWHWLLGSRGTTVVCTAGVLSALAIAGRLAYCAARMGAETRTARNRQRAMLTLLARHDRQLDALVVDHESTAAYCLPGRKAQIVVTSAAVETLDRAQLEAVLAHERAHLRGHHHLVVALAETLSRAFPFVPAFAAAAGSVPRLVEMAADDVAVRGRERHALATALVRLAEGGAPVAALGAGGETALLRIRRLTSAPVGLGTLKASLVLSTAAFMLVVPVGLVAGASIWFPFLQTCL